ncbi:MAG: hypothetical protein KJ063_05715 [Anaerolineae bacterium]|nr:hypothetical protein [Anaerolineae bacterium]
MEAYRNGIITLEQLNASVQGWVNHVRYANSIGLRKVVLSGIRIGRIGRLDTPHPFIPLVRVPSPVNHTRKWYCFVPFAHEYTSLAAAAVKVNLKILPLYLPKMGRVVYTVGHCGAKWVKMGHCGQQTLEK